MRAIDPLLAEFEQEAATTRRVLEVLPDDQFGWKPHERSFSLGELGAHVAQIPANMKEILGGDSFDFDDRQGETAAPATKADLLAHFDGCIAEGKSFLDSLDDGRATAEWTLKKGGEPLFAMPRIAAIRGFMMNHLYHHRGQLSVYLRLLDEPVPSVYGPTADVNPFG